MHQKNFKQWWIKKENVHKKNNSIYPKEREIWFVHRWINIWYESDWKWWFLRPVIVVKKIWSLFFFVTLTTKHKNNNFHYLLKDVDFDVQSSVMLSQWRIIDSKRFSHNIWRVGKKEFTKIKNLMNKMYFS